MDEDNKVEKRAFPRMKVQCPVLYLVKSQKRWQVAKLEDFAATGIRMVCDENLPINTEVSIQIKPGSLKTVPEFSAEACVVRCEENPDQRFAVSCKVIRVVR
jgi:hypothetical protein